MTTRVPNSSSSSVVPLDPLKALSATWRRVVEQIRTDWDDPNSHTADGYDSGAEAIERLLNEPDALLAVSSQRTEEKEDTRVD